MRECIKARIPPQHSSRSSSRKPTLISSFPSSPIANSSSLDFVILLFKIGLRWNVDQEAPAAGARQGGGGGGGAVTLTLVENSSRLT